MIKALVGFVLSVSLAFNLLAGHAIAYFERKVAADLVLIEEAKVQTQEAFESLRVMEEQAHMWRTMYGELSNACGGVISVHEDHGNPMPGFARENQFSGVAQK